MTETAGARFEQVDIADEKSVDLAVGRLPPGGTWLGKQPESRLLAITQHKIKSQQL